jgi:hypothetical protein
LDVFNGGAGISDQAFAASATAFGTRSARRGSNGFGMM